jgi:hypothetical protein
MSSITIDALRIYPKASLSPSDRLGNCKSNISKNKHRQEKHLQLLESG